MSTPRVLLVLFLFCFSGSFRKDAQPDEIQIEVYRKKTDGCHILLDRLHEELDSLELGTGWILSVLLPIMLTGLDRNQEKTF